MPSNFEQLVFEIIATDKNASAAFDRFRQKVDQTSRSVEDNSKSVDKNTKSYESLSKKITDTIPLLGNLGGMSGMGLLIAAGTALSPVIATVGVGVAGFGLAAAGAVKPILDAAQKTGGLRANMTALDPEQRKLAQSVLGLGDQYKQFEKALQPQVLAVFSRGVQIAGHLMRDIQPVAKATGVALDVMLSRVDKEFASGTWQSFFAWMAAHVGPDIKQLTDLLVTLLHNLPALLEALQPVAQGLLNVGTAAAKAVGPVAKLTDAAVKSQQAQLHAAKGADSLVETWTDKYIPGAKAVNDSITWWQRHLTGAGDAQAEVTRQVRENTKVTPINDLAVKSLAAASSKSATSMKDAAAAAAQERLAVSVLTGAIKGLSSGLLSSEQAQVAWKQAQQASTQAIKAATSSLDSNKASSLAARAAIIQSTQSALAFAQQEVNLHHNTDAASQIIRAQIRYLQDHAGKSKIAKDEIDALRQALQRLPGHVVSRVDVVGHGRGGISFHDQIAGQKADGTLEFHSRGARIPGYGGGDRVPAMLEPGETVVPKHLTPAVAPLMKAYGIKGFAAGGLITGGHTAINTAIPWMSTTEAGFERAAIRHAIADAKAAARALAAQSIGNIKYKPGAGVLQWGPLVRRALIMEHLNPLLAAQVMYQMQTESGGNPNAINLTDINAQRGDPSRGLMQVIGSTFAAYHWPGTSWNIYNPLANIAAALNYARHVYGPSLMSGGMGIGSGHGYDSGGWLPPGLTLAYNGTGRPERVLGPGQGGTIINIHVSVPPSANKRAVAREIADTLLEHTKAGGRLYPQGVTPR